MQKEMIVILAALSFSGLAYGGYIPPAQIQCRLNDANQINCKEFDRNYLTEDTYSADLQKNVDKTLYFHSAEAYFNETHDEVSVFYTYKTLRFKMVKLVTVNSSIQPDLEKGGWKKFDEDTYICDTGNEACGITNLPG